jgi:hypothetical protein
LITGIISMTITDLSPKESAALLDQVLSRAESRHLECKRVSGKMVSKALETFPCPAGPSATWPTPSRVRAMLSWVCYLARKITTKQEKKNINKSTA